MGELLLELCLGANGYDDHRNVVVEGLRVVERHHQRIPVVDQAMDVLAR